MKQIYLLLCCILLLLSCSKTEPFSGEILPDGDKEDPKETLEACFTLSGETIFVGETLEISNCSKGGGSYSYDFGNGSTSSDPSPEIQYEEGGTYTITLTVTNAKEETETFSLPVNVTSLESYYIYQDIPEGYSYLPLEAGIHPQTGAIYLIELRVDLLGPGGSKFFYRALNTDFTSVTHYIADMPFNANSAFVNFLPNGNQNFHFPRTLAGLYGSQELTYDGSWGFLSNINPANKHSYGCLADGGNFLYFGTVDDAGTYKAAIETRNSSGDAFQIDLHALGAADSMIGDMLRTGNGFVAFGGIFSKNDLAPQISGYTPVLAFLDADLNLISEVVLESSELESKISSPNDLNGAYHLAQLSNGNLVLYGNGELMVTDSNGILLKQRYFEGSTTIQALHALGDTFLISTDGYLRKFSDDGTQIKELKYDGNYLPEFLEVDGTMFFAAGYDSDEGVKLFYGAVDSDLNFVIPGS